VTSPSILSIETLPAPLAPEKPKQVIRCSNLERLDLCPGSLEACKDLESKSSEASEAGTRGHDWLAGNKAIVLPDGDLELAQRFDEAEQEMARSFFGEDVPEAEHEVALTVDFGKFILSGHIDRLRRAMMALLTDWKFGFLPVIESALNPQGMGYSYLVFRCFGIEDIRVCFRTRHDPGTMESASYGFADLIAARKRIVEIVERAMAPNAPRVPSEAACRYCQARGTERCPETQKAVEWWGDLDIGIVGTKKEAREKYMQSILASATPEQRARALGWYKIARPTLETFYNTLKDEAERKPGFVPGWEIQKHSGDRIITNPFEALKALVAGGVMTEKELWGFVEIPLAKIEKAYTAAQKKADPKFTEKKAKERIAEVLGVLIQSDGEKQSLVRSKDAPGTIDAEKKEK